MNEIIANSKPQRHTLLSHWSFLSLFICTILFATCSTSKKVTIDDREKKKSEQLDFNRSGFGNSPLQFWYPLTDFEVMALKNREKSKQGDPDALFALAVFASGNSRDMETYRTYHTRLENFIKKIKPKIDKRKKIQKKGDVLFREMCKEFFKLRIINKELKGYRKGQSQITEIFRTGKFNCISSSLLFVVLARYVGLAAKGVSLPSHTFVQLETPTGKIIEVETTIKKGYGLKHDKKFYQKDSKIRYAKRYLAQSSYEDYLKRQILEPYELICLNMNNQHTGEKRMSAFDRNRLLEAMGYVNFDDRYCQQNRLVVYNNEFYHLNKNQDFNTLAKMFSKIHTFLPDLRHKWHTDKDMLNDITLIEYEYAFTLQKTGRSPEAILSLEKLLPSLNPDFRLYNDLLNNAMAIISSYCNQLMKEKRFDESLSLLNKFNAKDVLHNKLNEGYRWLYEFWAQYCWEKRQWAAAIEKNEKALTYVSDKKDKIRVYQNIEGAYCNWAIEYSNAGNKSKARNVLKQCIKNYPQAKTCKENLKTINK